MFWNDPHMYGASFPYKDFPTPVQLPITGQFPMWQNIPRLAPNYYGFVPPTYDPRVVPFDPFQTRGIVRDPFQMNLPYQMNLPFQMHLPLHTNPPYDVNLPFYGYQRPFF